MPVHSNGNPFMFLPRPSPNAVPLNNGFYNNHRQSPNFNMANMFMGFQNKNQNSAVDQSGCPFQGNINTLSEFNGPKNWMNVPPPPMAPVPPVPQTSRMPFPVSYAGVTQGLHLNKGMRFPPPNIFERPGPVIQNQTIRPRSMSNVNRSTYSNYHNYALNYGPQHFQTVPTSAPPMLHSNRAPFFQNRLPSRNNGYAPNVFTPPPNGYFDSNSNRYPFPMIEPPNSSKDSLSASFQSHCRIEMNRIQQQDSFHTKFLNVTNKQQLETQTGTYTAYTSNTIPRQTPDAQGQSNAVETKWNLQNQNIEAGSESINKWILNCSSEASDHETVKLDNEENENKEFDLSQNDVSFQDFLITTENDVKGENCAEQQYQYQADQEYPLKENNAQGDPSSEGSETISSHNPEELDSETAENCTPENNENTATEIEEEPKKYSKSYWRKQRRLRLKERLMAEKLNMETGPDHKKSEEEMDATKGNKAVKSAGEILL